MGAVNGDQPLAGSWFGLDPGRFYATGAEGSSGAPAARPDGSSLGVQHISPVFDSSQGGNGYSVPQGTDSTNAASNPLKDIVSGVSTPPAVPAGGRVIAPRGPGSGQG